MAIMPDWIPAHAAMVYVSGVAEFVAGFLLIRDENANLGAWIAFALLIAVYPANLNMAFSQRARIKAGGGREFPQTKALLRLPVQFAFLWWVLRYTTLGWAETLTALPFVGGAFAGLVSA
mmetsp:Transcript_24411/g.84857  ORF Transcript_24411/g.84857 Transcript_24411/m.84857 type:complete len:120 (+) Transcript_24411:400-759(+)